MAVLKSWRNGVTVSSVRSMVIVGYGSAYPLIAIYPSEDGRGVLSTLGVGPDWPFSSWRDLAHLLTDLGWPPEIATDGSGVVTAWR